MTVVCPSANIPASGGTLVCTYSTPVSSGAAQTNTATATLAGQSYNSSAVPVSFAAATVTKVDDCITVTDTNVGTLGSYNEGLIGPGHCSEDSLSRTATR